MGLLVHVLHDVHVEGDVADRGELDGARAVLDLVAAERDPLVLAGDVLVAALRATVCLWMTQRMSFICEVAEPGQSMSPWPVLSCIAAGAAASALASRFCIVTTVKRTRMIPAMIPIEK